jgi:hypothetical protein
MPVMIITAPFPHRNQLKIHLNPISTDLQCVSIPAP